MALQYTVTKEDYSKLDAGVQALYSQHGDEYRLIVTGFRVPDWENNGFVVAGAIALTIYVIYRLVHLLHWTFQ